MLVKLNLISLKFLINLSILLTSAFLFNNFNLINSNILFVLSKNKFLRI